MTLIAQGAEAVILKESDIIIKRRVRKSYRLQELDQKIRKQRTKSELRLLQKASAVIPVPKIIKSSEFDIELEFIKGRNLSLCLDNLKNHFLLCTKIGENIAKLHDSNIIHGDLTTSNMIFSENKVYFIDFGLGFISPKIEDKAVDLHVLKEALNARHFKKAEKYWSFILKGYKSSNFFSIVIKQLEKVEKRGRYKAQY